MSMSIDDRKEFVVEINSMRTAIFNLIKRVGDLEFELETWREAASENDSEDDPPRSLAEIIGEAADSQRFKRTH